MTIQPHGDSSTIQERLSHVLLFPAPVLIEESSEALQNREDEQSTTQVQGKGQRDEWQRKILIGDHR